MFLISKELVGVIKFIKFKNIKFAYRALMRKYLFVVINRLLVKQEKLEKL